MKRYALLSAALAVALPTVMYAGQVNLQDTTPGTPQTGHLNITGTAKAGTVVGYSNTLTGIAYGGDFRSVSTSGRGILGNASATTGVTYGGLFQSFSTSGRGIAGITAALTGPTVGGFFTANSVNGKGVQGSSNATSGLNYGVYGRDVSPNGFALYGEGNGAFTGNLGIGTGTTPVGDRLVVAGNASISGTITGNGSGLSNLNASALATGTVADGRLSTNIPLLNAANVFTGNDNYFQNGTLHVGSNPFSLYGGDVIVASTNSGSAGIAVRSLAGGEAYFAFQGGSGAPARLSWDGTKWAFIGNGPTALTLGPAGNLNLGAGGATPQMINATAFSNSLSVPSALIGNGSPVSNAYARVGTQTYASGSGLNVGLSSAAISSDADSYAVVGAATGATNNYGVFGTASGGSGDNYAGYFDGVLFAISASAGVKSFLIDHPLDPANKYLRHSSIESDERMNLYRGEVTTDSTGFATVTMPTWFEALNEKIQYQLTVVDDSGSADFVLTKVAQRLKNGKFKIRTSQPNVVVNWMVSGHRHDPTSQYMPLVVEEDKKGTSRGKYLVPEAYGKDASFAIVARPKVEMAKSKK